MRGFADEEQNVVDRGTEGLDRVDSIERRVPRPSTPSNHQCADFSK
jgi:hypothetical protein